MGLFNSNPVFEVCIRCNLKIGEIVSLNASSQSRSTSDIFSEPFCGTALAGEQEQDNITAHICFLCVESTKMVFAVVVPRACFVLLGTVSLALPVDSPVLFVQRVLRV